MATKALDRFFEQQAPTAQRRLLDIWLALPRGEARESFFYEYLVAPGTPEERLAAYRATQTQEKVA